MVATKTPHLEVNYSVYHICKHEDEGDLSKGYVGISNDWEARLEKHFSGNGSVVVSRAHMKYGELSYSIICCCSEEEAKLVERWLRPTPGVGWNIAAGGGLPPNNKGKAWTDNQRKLIPLANSGPKQHLWKGYWVVDGTRYESLLKASIDLGCAKRTVRNRCLSSKFPNWKFEEVVNGRV